MRAYKADKIFTGTEWLEQHAVLVDGDSIVRIIPVTALTADIETWSLDQAFLAPACIDLQIYGAYSKLLAAYPTADSLSLLKDYCERGGAALCLPTVATNTTEVFYQCIDAVRDYWQRGGEGIVGLHLEGPWINPVKRGAHIESLIHAPTLAEVKEMLEYGKGIIKMITLAPECCSGEMLDYMLSENILISAGHSNATYEEAIQSFSRGIKTVTHLYNAMSPLQHRAPGLVGATLDHDKVMASVIPDGYHVDYSALRIAKKIMKERLFVITDAVTETTTGYYPHELVGDKYEAGKVLSGSSLTMIKAVQNLVNFAGIELGESLRMCSLYPAKLAGLSNYGKIEAGYSSRMMAIDNDLNLLELL